MRIVITRPENEAQLWVQNLQAHALTALALPLITITATKTESCRQIWQHLAQPSLAQAPYRALMFVSGNAVRHFFNATESHQKAIQILQHYTAAQQYSLRFWSPGPGTTQALVAAGLAAHQIDAPAPTASQFDSEALWPIIQPQIQANSRILIVRGAAATLPDAAPSPAPAQAPNNPGSGRDWMARQLTQRHVQVDLVAAYVRQTPRWNPSQYQNAQTATKDGSIWLFSSSEALQNLHRLLPDQNWQNVPALCTHPRITQTARSLGFENIRETRPALDDVILALKAWR